VNAIWQLGFVGLFLIFSVLIDGFIRRGESM
jgi:predicted ABC-type sugar transport system permease subunit